MSIKALAVKMFKSPPLSATRGAKIEFIGNREAYIDGCKGIRDYSDETIGINIGGQTVRFSGRNLSIRNYERTRIEIEGYIVSVIYE